MLRRAAFIAVLAVGCHSGEQPQPTIAKAKAEADTKAAEIEKRRKEREAEAKAKEAAEKEHAAKIDALAVLPAKVPKKLDAACKQLLAAYDRYMLSVLEGDMQTKWKTGGNEMQLALFRKECLKRTPEIAACQANALSSLPVEMRTDIATVMERCAAKFGPDAKAG